MPAIRVVLPILTSAELFAVLMTPKPMLICLQHSCHVVCMLGMSCCTYGWERKHESAPGSTKWSPIRAHAFSYKSAQELCRVQALKRLSLQAVSFCNCCCCHYHSRLRSSQVSSFTGESPCHQADHGTGTPLWRRRKQVTQVKSCEAAKLGSACRAAIGETFRLICCHWWQKACQMMNFSAAGEHMHVCRQEQRPWWLDGGLLPCRVVCKRWRLGFSLAVHSLYITQSVWAKQWPAISNAFPLCR